MKKITAAVAAAVILCGCTANTPSAQTDTTAPETTAAQTEIQSETRSEAAETESSETAEDTQTSSDTEAQTSADTEQTTAEETPAGNDYRTLYKAKLREIMDEHKNEDMSTFRFSLYDVGGDDTPELIISEGEWHAASAELFAVKDGSVEFIGYVGSYGEAVYMPGKKAFNNANGGMGYFYNTLTEFDGSGLKDGISIEGYSGPDYNSDDYDTTIEEYTVNGEKVTSDEYYKTYEENFDGYFVSLGRNFFINEHAISAVFDDLGAEKGFDELILSVPTEGEQWGLPEKMAYVDMTGDGSPELIFSNGYSCDMYSYDKGVKYAGSIPSYGYSPYEYFSTMDLDVDYSETDTVYTLTVNEKEGKAVWRQHSLSDDFYISTYESGMLYALHHYQAIKLTDGTYVYAVDGKQTDESDYDTYTQGLFSDDYKEIEFYGLAVG